MEIISKSYLSVSHAACYAVVSYQTAYLKYYYPKEFMAALMTSVMDNVSKVSEYIFACRQMKIPILPPDINYGEGNFSVDGEGIRYGLSAIKSIGKSVVNVIVKERENNGIYTSIDNFVDRLSNKEVNKRTIESFIKSGALDSLPGNRKQKLHVAPLLLEQKSKDKKNVMEGQISLFDFAGDDDKEKFQITMKKEEEFDKQQLLAFEKETLGIYVSGHPMEDYEESWKKQITAISTDFILDEETEKAKLDDGERVVIGGMITGKTIKTTKTNSIMAFITLEDMYGSVEVIVFPKNYDASRELLKEEAKIFVVGRASIGDEPVGKMICEKIVAFEDVPKQLWIQFENKENYLNSEKTMLEVLKESEGHDQVVIYLKSEKAKKVLPSSWNIGITDELLLKLSKIYSEKNVKVVEKNIEKIR